MRAPQNMGKQLCETLFDFQATFLKLVYHKTSVIYSILDVTRLQCQLIIRWV